MSLINFSFVYDKSISKLRFLILWKQNLKLYKNSHFTSGYCFKITHVLSNGINEIFYYKLAYSSNYVYDRSK